MPDDVIRSTRLLEIRTGRVKPLGPVLSAIDKELRHGPVAMGTLGLEGDEQADRTFHGGPDKAVLHYAMKNYEAWRAEFPADAAAFQPGRFGENLISHGFSEENVCVGDVFRIGAALVEVSQPRNPCFKLNHRFQQPSMSRRVQETGRTGWYYRVLTPGPVEAGAEIVLVERPHPDWPLRRVQHYLYVETMNLAALEELAALPQLSGAMRAIATKRIQSSAPEIWDARLIGVDGAAAKIGEVDRAGWRIVRVESVRQSARGVKSLRLVDPAARPLPPFAAGAHISIEFAGNLIRHYSLCGPLGSADYEIAVGLAPASRGGSHWLHHELKPGDILSISPPKNRFGLAEDAARHLMIAGGIGITPFIPMIEACMRDGRDFELHYCARTPEDAAFADRLAALPAGNVHFHYSGGRDGRRLDCAKLLQAQIPGTHVYCCGPDTLMRSVRDATKDWQAATIHFEKFLAEIGDAQAFFVKIASTGAMIEVGPRATILQALRRAGITIPSSCETGSCGTCRVKVLAGAVDHRDVVLSEEERATEIATCVSRARGDVLTLDL
jgi:MOSC domain-containing protein YiiM/ferredoxin-NADP reductase